MGKDGPGPHHARELRAAPSSPKRPELPSDGPLPRFLHSLGPVTGPRSPFPPGPIFPKASYHFLMLYKSVHRGKRWRTLPAPNQCVHRVFRRAKFTDASKAGQRGWGPICLYLGASLSRSPRPRITKLECVPLRGRCYGDFINNIIFRIPVP